MKKERQKRLLSILLALAMVFTIGIQGSAYAQTNDGSLEQATDEICSKYKTGVNWDKLVPGEDYVHGEMVVTFADDLESEELIYEIASEHGFEVLEVLGFFDWEGGKLANFSVPDGMSVPEAIQEIEQDERVQNGTPNGIFKFCSSTNDPYYVNQWYIDRIGLDEAWDISKCNNEVTVAVIDTGIDHYHPDLADNILTEYAWDFTTGTDDACFDSHGTHVAGIIAAIANNNEGITGASYNANIIPIRVTDDEEPESSAFLTNVWKGFKYAVRDVDCDTLKVINFSGRVRTEYFSIESIINEAAANGIVTVCAAGNEHSDAPTYPACYDACIAVMGTDSNDAKYEYSNYGYWCDICAPAVNIYSTISLAYGDYMNMTGTSMAAPIISSVIALMYAANPDLTIDQVKYILYDTAVDLGADGRDNNFGWGRVDAYAAVLRACEGYWERIAGTDRYFTMKNISQKGWEDNSCDTVVVATGASFPDALTGTALAGVYDSPLILTGGSTLSAQAAIEIERLGATNAIIIGGPGVISDTVKASIENIVGTGHVTRVYGANRFGTAYSVYNNNVNDWSDTLIVATGMNAADVLSIAPYAYATKSPIFLANQYGNLNADMQAAVQAGNFNKAVIIGSSDIVSAQTENLLVSELDSGNVIRLYGSDRYKTSSIIADWESGELTTYTVQPSVVLDYANVGMVNGAANCFADALAGGPFCGKMNSVMLLTQDLITDNDHTNYTVQNNVIPHVDDIEIGYVIGGPGALSELFEHYLESLCQ